MRRRVFFPNSFPDGGCSQDVSSEIERLVAAGRAELPASDLAQRVREAVAYRRVLAEARPAWLPRGHAPRALRFSMAIGSLAVAAGALLWWHSAHRAHRPSISPEPIAAVSNAAGEPHNHEATEGSNSAGARRSEQRQPSPADPCQGGAVAAGKQPVIDDFEDGDDEVLRLEGRSGLWRWARDTDAAGSAPALLPIPRAQASATNRLALHVVGGRLLDWGAIVEFNFRPACYNASAYGGLIFKAKGPGRVFVAPREIGTIPVAEGGTCRSDCYNPHVKKVELERQWKIYRIEWSDFEQRGYGRPAFDPTRLHSLAFLIRPEDTPYDVWFDDVSFSERVPR